MVQWAVWKNALWIFLAVGLYGALHSALATPTAKAWARQKLGRFGDRWYRLGYNLLFTVLLFPLLAVPAALPDRVLYVVRPPWVYVTTALQIGGLLLAADATFRTDLWAFLGLKPEPEATAEALVIRGAYRWVRHPMYSGSLLFIWAMPVMTLNSALFYAALTLYIVLGAHWEERKLLAEYGEAYARYRQEVPMLIPRFWRKT
ncbi:MAG: isoprenylcysteine carboxylmethyltransferase family protein [Chloroflexi bacterium]|nr:isoprenylcysteine carboxylmethyltransferase family protein [Chloroflexota bacterium]